MYIDNYPNVTISNNVMRGYVARNASVMPGVMIVQAKESGI
jgi:hypothetical protein